MKAIDVFWPTVRPQMMRENWYGWLDKAVHPERVHLHIIVDNSDHASYFSDFNELTVFKAESRGIVKPLNKLLEGFKSEDPSSIMVVASDDFYPPTNWDMYLEEKFKHFNGVLKVNDGHMEDIVSIPILSYSAYVKMNNTIYHPAYDHMFCDKELHDTAVELGIIWAVPKGDPLWEHRHPHYQSRESDEFDKSNSKNFKDGKEIYRKRRYMTLQERLVREV